MNMITMKKTMPKNRSITSVSAELVRKVADVLQLAHTRDRIADPARLEIVDRQRQKVAEQPSAEFHVDAVRRMRE